MGSSSSHPVAPESSSSSSSSRKLSRVTRTKRNLSHIFCGVFRSKSTLQELGDDPEITSISYEKSLAPPLDAQNSTIESSPVFTSEAGDTLSVYENGDSSERSSVIEEGYLESGLLNVQTSRDHKTLPQQTAQESVSGNATDCIAAVIDSPDAITEDTASIYSGHDQSTNLAQGLTDSRAHSNDIVEYSRDEDVGHNSSDLRSLSIVSDSDSLPRFQYPGDDRAHTTTTSSSGFLVSDSDQDLRNGDLLRLDLVSISSNSLSGSIAEINSHETRRNSMRLFWDALARRSLRRNIDSPTIVFATGLADDLGSHDRWLLDFSGDLHYYGSGRDLDSYSDLQRRHERRWLLRSEVSETLSGIDGEDQQTALCASGLHLDGSCSCDSFFTAEESSSLASISRIILLAEALFEVLDEIHSQSLSLSLSTLSLPAPESVVDAFPLKYYKKSKNVESDSTDVRQCYICLSDYEEGDRLRVLPCNHEFHIPCIDKWLKEVNRVCPVCRHDVCEGRGECSVSNPEVSSR
ncbi:RING/U-box superfamily protein [Perilla frutescens var. hirtella]|uniref:RING/U-box superfamily protein n=1 Tax=Perilla frutescens var. hirtella TaxID=608512 RepID=A0AAD4ILP0_PERFH|nr:RING/U-box superfamily protein [Perilla frutescens var. hirtella]